VLVLSVDSFPVVAELLVLLDADIPGAADGDALLPGWTKASMALAQFPIDLYLWGGRERLQPAGQAGRPPLALTRGMLPFLLSCPPPSAVRPVCSMFVWKEAQAKQAMGKRSERGGGEEGEATDDCNRDCKSATATVVRSCSSGYSPLPLLGPCLVKAVKIFANVF